MGRFLLVHNGEYTPLECLSIYRNRDSIEKAFRILKTDLDIFPMRGRKESATRGYDIHILHTVNAGTIQTLFHRRKWIRIKPAITHTAHNKDGSHEGNDLIRADKEVFPGEDDSGTGEAACC